MSTTSKAATARLQFIPHFNYLTLVPSPPRPQPRARPGFTLRRSTLRPRFCPASGAPVAARTPRSNEGSLCGVANSSSRLERVDARRWLFAQSRGKRCGLDRKGVELQAKEKVRAYTRCRRLASVQRCERLQNSYVASIAAEGRTTMIFSNSTIKKLLRRQRRTQTLSDSITN